MKARLQQAIESALEALLQEAGDRDPVPAFALDPPRQADHGDFACNAAMVLAKRLGRPSRAIADDLVARLGMAEGLLEKSEVAGPGFVNLWLSGERWQGLLRDIVAAGAGYGRSDEGKGERVQVEFVSANPTGPLSTGHGRQGVLGDCIARLLEFSGYEVTREYYFNNGGRQMRVLGDSVKARYLEAMGRAAPPPAEAFCEGAEWPESIDGLPVVFPSDGYQGDYVAEIAESLRAERGESLVDEPGDGAFRERAEQAIFAEIRATLDRLGIHFDFYVSEMALYQEGKIDEALADLREAELVYDSEGASWLKATALGLERDRVVVKSSGELTYLMPDIAYHREKFRRGFDRVIDVQGSDHIAQFPFLQAAVGALGVDPERIELVLHQFVTITSGGKRVKQSTRAATYITVDEVLDDIDADVFRFFMVARKADGHLDFDLDKARDRNWRNNPAYRVQYAHARTLGIERKAAQQGVPLPGVEDFDPARLTRAEEIELVKALGEFPELVGRAMRSREPHHVAHYLINLAGLWNAYLQDGENHRILSEDAALCAARLGLARAMTTVLANGLGLLGVSAPESM